MRPAIHPDGAPRLGSLEPHFDGDELLGVRITFFPVAIITGREVRVRNAIAGALLLPNGHPGCGPRQRRQPPRFIQRYSAIIDERTGGGSISRILMSAVVPGTRN